MLKFHLALVLTLSLLTLSSHAQDWKPVQVPGEQQVEGYAWYRTWLKPHPTFFSKHERDLFGESVILNVRSLVGAHEVFVNGKSIGTGGQFPPDFKDGREGNHRHKGCISRVGGSLLPLISIGVGACPAGLG